MAWLLLLTSDNDQDLQAFSQYFKKRPWDVLSCTERQLTVEKIDFHSQLLDCIM